MATLQEQYDEAMFDFSLGDFDASIGKLKAILAQDPAHFDAQLSLGMAYCRKGDFATAIAAVLSTPEIELTMQAASAERARSYTWRSAAVQLSELTEQLISRRLVTCA